MKATISSKILDQLNAGKNRLNKEARNHFVHFIKSQLLANQSFMDKSAKSDLYYTLFGWTLCLIFNIKLDTKKMLLYIQQQPEKDLDLIHYTSLKRCYLIYHIMAYGKVFTWLKMQKKLPIKSLNEFISLPHQDMNAPYSQFIWMLLSEDTGNRNINPLKIEKALSNYHVLNGGYLNNKECLTSTNNATVAALSVLGQLNNYKKNEDLSVLTSFQNSSGGFVATKSSPIPDLLSTATALFVLKCYNEKATYPTLNFIEAHWSDSGGFVGTLMDDKSDIEYCFYGLLALGCA